MEAYSEYLMHHGIPGMKWGKRNGPPYPLSSWQMSSRELKRQQKENYKEIKRAFNKKESSGSNTIRPNNFSGVSFKVANNEYVRKADDNYGEYFLNRKKIESEGKLNKNYYENLAFQNLYYGYRNGVISKIVNDYLGKYGNKAVSYTESATNNIRYKIPYTVKELLEGQVRSILAFKRENPEFFNDDGSFNKNAYDEYNKKHIDDEDDD